MEKVKQLRYKDFFCKVLCKVAVIGDDDDDGDVTDSDAPVMSSSILQHTRNAAHNIFISKTSGQFAFYC